MKLTHLFKCISVFAWIVSSSGEVLGNQVPLTEDHQIYCGGPGHSLTIEFTGSIAVHRGVEEDLMIPAQLAFSECLVDSSSRHRCIRGGRILGEADFRAQQVHSQSLSFYVKGANGTEGAFHIVFPVGGALGQVELRELSWSGFSFDSWIGQICQLRAAPSYR